VHWTATLVCTPSIGRMRARNQAFMMF
jgi:hypothetical protein